MSYQNNAIRRGNQISGKPEKANLYDIQRVIHFSDNRSGWRKFSPFIQSIFRVNSEKGSYVNAHTSVKPLCISKRKRNKAYDLVGIELNPGDQNRQKKKNSSSKQLVPRKSQPKAKRAPYPMMNVKGGGQYSSSAVQYMKSVLAPCATGARIPDLNCLPTSTVTLTQEGSSTVTAGGVGGGKFNIGTVPSRFDENTGTTTDAAITYGTETALLGASTLSTNFLYVRVVSACVDVIFTGASLSDSGIVVGWTLGCMSGSTETAPTTLSSAQATRANRTNRVRDGVSLFYRPTDSSSFLFNLTSSNVQYGALGFHISGAAASAVLYWKITINFECIPKLDQFISGVDMGLKPSPVDVNGHGAALNKIASAPSVLNAQEGSSLTQSLRKAGDTFSSVWGYASLAFDAVKYLSPLLL